MPHPAQAPVSIATPAPPPQQAEPAGGGSSPQAPPPPPRTDPTTDPLVRKAIELLNARIVDIKPKPPRA
jgi:hypothetical protein